MVVPLGPLGMPEGRRSGREGLPQNAGFGPGLQGNGLPFVPFGPGSVQIPVVP